MCVLSVSVSATPLMSLKLTRNVVVLLALCWAGSACESCAQKSSSGNYDGSGLTPFYYAESKTIVFECPTPRQPIFVTPRVSKSTVKRMLEMHPDAEVVRFQSVFLEGEALKPVVDSAKVRQLLFQFTNLDDAMLHDIAAMNRLERLTIRDALITDASAKDLRLLSSRVQRRLIENRFLPSLLVLDLECQKGEKGISSAN